MLEMFNLRGWYSLSKTFVGLLIEKECVQKAKDIIKQTQNDPHVQSKELNIFKADYMQKRYNKVLKLSE